ncbi:MAG: MarR family transcriptional regulator [Candidatus Dormiibacter spiritus]|nr:MAG: MarR family transcriptional regulator [Candidatus Dormibacteraeota bacterium]
MRQVETLGELDRSMGYVLKQASAALRSAMEEVLLPLQLTMPQYACLELLSRRSGQSSAELARGAFVTRQSMNQVLRGLHDRGLLTRPAVAARGRALPTQLTPEGVARLQVASAAVVGVEQRMVASLTADDQQRLLRHLATCAHALS